VLSRHESERQRHARAVEAAEHARHVGARSIEFRRRVVLRVEDARLAVGTQSHEGAEAVGHDLAA